MGHLDLNESEGDTIKNAVSVKVDESGFRTHIHTS